MKLDRAALDALQAQTARLDRLRARVGVLASKGGDQKHPEADITLTELAFIHEFGNDHIPERSFIRASVAKHAKEIESVQARVLALFLNGKIDEDKALNLLGSFVASIIKRYITDGEHIPPPLSPVTIARKDSSRPLVDTGHLVRAIDYEITTDA